MVRKYSYTEIFLRVFIILCLLGIFIYFLVKDVEKYLYSPPLIDTYFVNNVSGIVPTIQFCPVYPQVSNITMFSLTSSTPDNLSCSINTTYNTDICVYSNNCYVFHGEKMDQITIGRGGNLALFFNIDMILASWGNGINVNIYSNNTNYAYQIDLLPVQTFNDIKLNEDYTILLNGTTYREFRVDQIIPSNSILTVNPNRVAISISSANLPLQFYNEKQSYTLSDLIQSILTLISPMMIFYQVMFGKSKLNPFGLIDRIILRKYHIKNLNGYKNIGDENKLILNDFDNKLNMNELLCDYYIDMGLIHDNKVL